MKQRNDSQAMQYLQRLPNEQSFSMKSLYSDKSKLYSKLQSKNDFNCIYIHENTLYLGTKNSKVYIYEIKINQLLHKEDQEDFVLKQIKMITPHCKVVSLIKANNDYFVTVPETDDDCFISVWSASSQNFLVCLQGHKSQVSSVVFMKSQAYFVSASWDATIRIWDLQKIQSLKPIKTFKGNYPILVIKQYNEQVLIFGGDDCYLVFWNWKRGEVIKKEFGHAGSVTYIDIIGDLVFTSGGDNKFRFWEILISESTQTSIQSPSIDFKQKYKIKKVAQVKQQYDPIVFGTFYENYLVIIDKRGDIYLFTEDTQIYRMENYFAENEEISGVDIYGDFVMVTTTKGILKHIYMKKQLNKMTCSIKTKKTIPSTTNIIQIDSNILPEKDRSKIDFSQRNKSKRQKSQIQSLSSRLRNDNKSDSRSDRNQQQ